MRPFILLLAISLVFCVAGTTSAQDPVPYPVPYQVSAMYQYAPTLPVRPVSQIGYSLPTAPLSSVTYPLHQSIYMSRQRFNYNRIGPIWAWREWRDDYGNSYMYYRQLSPMEYQP
jgi:hypothetical protein